MFDSEKFSEGLTTRSLGRVFHYLPSVDSTNRYLLESTLPVGAVVVAGQQTAGRGRSGRGWSSDTSENLYFTTVLPTCAPKDLFPLNILTGYALVDALRSEAAVQLKWPNDLVINGRKCAGMLLEARFSGNTLDRLVVGIGLNVNSTTFPPEVAEVATSLRLATGKEFAPESVLASILNELEQKIDEYQAGELNIRQIWSHYSAFLDKPIRVHINGVRVPMTERGITFEGCLLAENADGVIEEIHTGDIGYDFGS